LENIERTQFVVLTGHLDDQPLPDLIRTLRVQRKSGRLQIEYPDGPGSFFFEDGQLVDAQLGSLRGLEAFYAAIELRGASFNFNPLVRPPERSIDRQQQKFISDMVEVPRRENLAEIKFASGGFHAGAAAAIADSPNSAPLQLAPMPAELIAPLEVRLTAVEEAINTTSRRFSRERLLYAIVISFLVGLTAVTALQALFNLRKTSALLSAGAATASQKPDAVNSTTTTTATTTAATGGEAIQAVSPVPIKKEGNGVAPAGLEAAADKQPSGPTKKAKPSVTTKQIQMPRPTPTTARDSQKLVGTGASGNGGYVTHVFMEVKNGQVTEARVLNPRPGASSYDSIVLRMAKQRRYPNSFTGSDTVMFRVKP